MRRRKLKKGFIMFTTIIGVALSISFGAGIFWCVENFENFLNTENVTEQLVEL